MSEASKSLSGWEGGKKEGMKIGTNEGRKEQRSMESKETVSVTQKIGNQVEFPTLQTTNGNNDVVT